MRYSIVGTGGSLLVALFVSFADSPTATLSLLALAGLAARRRRK